MLPDPKATLVDYLQNAREAMLWKLEGLSEHDVRRPLTPTGTNLLGLVKHLASVELGYLGDTFGRPHGEDLTWQAVDADPQADMWATPEETRDDIVGLYRRAWHHGATTIEQLALDAVGEVPWWAPEDCAVTLHQVLVHLVAETCRHAGHADLLREGIDGAIGRFDHDPSAGEYDYATYRRRVEDAANVFRGPGHPTLLHTVLDTTDCRGLAEFYRELLGLRYRPGSEPPTEGPDDEDWLVLVDAAGQRQLAIQLVERLESTTWPDHDVPMQLHVDYTVPDVDELERHRRRAEELGARLLLDRTDDADEPLYVLADPAGHPFCLFVG